MQSPFITTELACALVAATASLSSSYAGGGGILVVTGTSNYMDMSAPIVKCIAVSATEDFPLSGIWHIKTDIEVKEMAATSSVNGMNTLVGDIQSAFLTPGIESLLMSKVNNYFVYQVLFDGFGFQVDGDAWNHKMGLEIVCSITGSSPN